MRGVKIFMEQMFTAGQAEIACGEGRWALCEAGTSMSEVGIFRLQAEEDVKR